MRPPPIARTATSRMAARMRGIDVTPWLVDGPPWTLSASHPGERSWSRCGGGMASFGSSGLDSGTCHCQYSAMPDDERYSLTELADLAGVTPRTVRYYLAQGLLPAVGQTGPGSKYDAGHLARLRVIRRLQAEHLPLAEIRRRLETLDDGEIRELVDAGEPTPPTDTALEYLRNVLAGPPNVRPSDPTTAAPAPAPSVGIVGPRSMSLPSVAPAHD